MKKATQTWLRYEAGKEYKARIGLYETVRRNERFYRGDQWRNDASDLPRPVFNFTRRITDYLVNSVISGDVGIHFTDERLPFVDDAETRARIAEGLRNLNRHISYRWKRNRMPALLRRALLDAAVTGDGIFYCWWDGNFRDGQPFTGDVRTDVVDSTNLIVADVNKDDIQSQEYLILSGRASVRSLRAEAIRYGATAEEAARIVGDSRTETQAGDLAATEMDGEEKATYLIRFYRRDGHVIFEKSTKELVIREVDTGLRLYPVAAFHWYDVKNSFHGSAPVSDLIANQKYINSAYAMAMKHMSDTAFSKIIYDKSRIPEWSNEVGEAIAAMGGGNVADAVSVVGVGQMQDGYLELIENVIENTKNMMGATESALGDAAANNTSAILALQEASRVTLQGVNTHVRNCIADLAEIWVDMLCAYCPEERLFAIPDADGNLVPARVNLPLLRDELISATVEIGTGKHYSPASTVVVLDKLLDGGHLTVTQYLELLPDGTVSDREAILSKLKEKENHDE